jgi:YHS domain-containing protein
MAVRVFGKGSFRIVLATVFLALSLIVLGAPRSARATELFNQSGDIAIYAYDPVAYFTDGQAVKGSNEFAYTWLGATWYFASAEHRALFVVDPVKYAPQYGGYCAVGMIGGQPSGANPENWRIVDGKLYLYGGPKSAMTWWERDAHENIEKADAQWELLKADLTQ